MNITSQLKTKRHSLSFCLSVPHQSQHSFSCTHNREQAPLHATHPANPHLGRSMQLPQKCSRRASKFRCRCSTVVTGSCRRSHKSAASKTRKTKRMTSGVSFAPFLATSRSFSLTSASVLFLSLPPIERSQYDSNVLSPFQFQIG